MSNLEPHPNFIQRAKLVQNAAEGKLENFGSRIRAGITNLGADLQKNGISPLNLKGIYKK